MVAVNNPQFGRTLSPSKSRAKKKAKEEAQMKKMIDDELDVHVSIAAIVMQFRELRRV